VTYHVYDFAEASIQPDQYGLYTYVLLTDNSLQEHSRYACLLSAIFDTTSETASSEAWRAHQQSPSSINAFIIPVLDRKQAALHVRSTDQMLNSDYDFAFARALREAFCAVHPCANAAQGPLLLSFSQPYSLAAGPPSDHWIAMDLSYLNDCVLFKTAVNKLKAHIVRDENPWGEYKNRVLGAVAALSSFGGVIGGLIEVYGSEPGLSPAPSRSHLK
jgi:hypothetical protein